MATGNTSVENDFMQYLSKQVSPSRLSDLYMCYAEIEKACLKNKVLQKPLFETTDFEIIKKVQRTIEQNKIFRITRRKRINTIIAAGRYYYNYIQEGRFPKSAEPKPNEPSVNPPMQAKIEAAPKPAAENKIRGVIESKSENITKPAAETPIERTEQDKRLARKYPIIYKRIFAALKDLSPNNTGGASVAMIGERINHIARPAVIEEILDNVSWADAVGVNYTYLAEAVDKSTADTNAAEPINNADTKQIEDASAATSAQIETVSETAAQARPLENAPIINKDEIYTLDFNGDFELKYTKPAGFIYFGEDKPCGTSWTSLYVSFIAAIIDDYPHIFSAGMTFGTGYTRIDIAKKDSCAFMIEPRQIPGTDYMLETNYSAKDTALKIKCILELCNVDFENVVITYKKKRSAPQQKQVTLTEPPPQPAEAPPPEPPADEAHTEPAVTIDSESFSRYMRDTLHMSKSDCQSYAVAIDSCESFAKMLRLPSCELYTNDCETAVKTALLLLQLKDGAFVKYNKQQCNRLSTALDYFIQFIKSQNPQAAEAAAELQSPPPTAPPKVAEAHTKSAISAINSESFSQYLHNTLKMSEPTCRSYASAIYTCESLAKELSLSSRELYTNDCEAALKTASQLLHNRVFINYNEQRHNRFSAALNRFTEFVETQIPSETAGMSSTQASKTPPTEVSLPETVPHTPTPPADEAHTEPVVTIDSESFSRYMRDTLHMTESTCKSYVSAIDSCESYAQKLKLSSCELYTSDCETAIKTASLLLRNATFINYNVQHRNRFILALNKFIQFVEAQTPFGASAVKALSETLAPSGAAAITDKDFSQYMRSTLHISAATCQSYAGAINACENFAKKLSLSSNVLYTDDRAAAVKTASLLLSNESFINYNVQHQNRYIAALNKFIQFIEEQNPQESADTTSTAAQETPIPTPAPPPEPPADKAHTEPAVTIDSESFSQYMRDTLHMATISCKSYASAINVCESFAQKLKLSSRKLYTNDRETALKTASLLLHDKVFISYNNRQHNRFGAALNKFVQFVEAQSTAVPPIPSASDTHVQSTAVLINKDAFLRYMRKNAYIAETTCQSYASAISGCEIIAQKLGLSPCALYTDDREAALNTASSLLRNAAFIDYNAQQHNRPIAALNKFIQFVNAQSPQETAAAPARQMPTPIRRTAYTNDEYAAVLKTNFQKGFRMNSPLEIRKFRNYYSVLHETELTDSDEAITQNIERLCIVHEGKAYLPEAMLSEDIKQKLIIHIRNEFAKGKTVIYYKALFNEFSDDFLDYHINNADMLKTYLAYLKLDGVYIQRSYISSAPNAKPDSLSEIRTCLQEYARPVKYEELFAALPHLPQEKIKHELSVHDEFIRNGKSEYFHESTIELSDEELDNISEIISDTIAQKDFISGNELYDAIKAKYPYIIENNQMYSVHGFRDALKYKLWMRFSFVGNIISPAGEALSMSKVFADFAKSRDSFTLTELQTLASELSTSVYFESVYDNSLRISREQFVSKNYARFDTEEIDAVLDRICTGSYISIQEVTGFDAFPYAGYAWNSFLLEHYAARYSKKYKLLHSGFNAVKCAGAIVKRSAGIDTFDDLVVDFLANAAFELKKEPALDALYKGGYIATRRYDKIERLIIRATAKRNRRDTE